ncbi:ROK family protein [Nocardioides sp. C4-1]|uniref:ROK family transcriptional regulator n=1 Tax=Nocardioides sp. C4-1 TaxID=3151851 RepID=UPI0032656A11
MRATRGLGGEVLRRLRDTGPQTKAQLAAGFDVPRTTLAGTLRQLVADGLVDDGPVAPSSGGRRSVSVRIQPDLRFVAVSIGERRIRVAALGGHLAITSGHSIDLAEHGDDVDAVGSTVLDAVADVVDGARPLALAMAAPDLAAPFAEALRARLADHLPDIDHVALSAVRAMALGERHSGAATGLTDVVAVRLGHSVTSATIAGGRLARGAASAAGEIGHLRVEEFGPSCTCGRTGCLDAYASSAAVVARGRELAERGRSPRLTEILDAQGDLTLADVVAGAEGGDAAVVQLAREAGQRLGPVVAGLVAHANPSRVVLGGPVAALGMHLLGDVRAAAYRLAPPRAAEGVEIVLSERGERAVLVGAGIEAFEAWTRDLAT